MGRSLVELLPVVGDLILTLSGPEGEWVPHSRLVSALEADSRFVTHISGRHSTGTGGRRPAWYAAATVAWFSRQFTANALPGADRFERQRAEDRWSYRRAWGPPPPLLGLGTQISHSDVEAVRCLFCRSVHAGEQCQTPTEVETPVYRGTRQQPIHSLEEWADVAFGHKRKLHWKDGKSAQECARAWFGRVPGEVTRLLDSDPAWRGFSPCTVVPEHVTRLDDYGPGRHHDLVVFGRVADARAIVCVEAKAGENFGALIGGRLDRAIGHTKLPRRANHLAEAVFGRSVYRYDENLKDLRYQLLHALAGTAIEAAQHAASRAALVVQFFPSSRKAIEESVAELENFLAQMPGNENVHVPEGQLVPVVLHGAGMVQPGATVHVGWVRSDLCPAAPE